MRQPKTMQIVIRSYRELQLATRLLEQESTLNQLLSQCFKQPVKLRTLEFESAISASAYFWELQIIVAFEDGQELPETRLLELSAEGKGIVAKYLRNLLRWFYRSDEIDPALGHEFWTNSDQMRIVF